MIENLSQSSINISKKIIEAEPLSNCTQCNAISGDCNHSTGIYNEDAITKELTPSEDEKEEKLSGNTEEILINPPIIQFSPRRPY